MKELVSQDRPTSARSGSGLRDYEGVYRIVYYVAENDGGKVNFLFTCKESMAQYVVLQMLIVFLNVELKYIYTTQTDWLSCKM